MELDACMEELELSIAEASGLMEFGTRQASDPEAEGLTGLKTTGMEHRRPQQKWGRAVTTRGSWGLISGCLLSHTCAKAPSTGQRDYTESSGDRVHRLSSITLTKCESKTTNTLQKNIILTELRVSVTYYSQHSRSNSKLLQNTKRQENMSRTQKTNWWHQPLDNSHAGISSRDFIAAFNKYVQEHKSMFLQRMRGHLHRKKKTIKKQNQSEKEYIYIYQSLYTRNTVNKLISTKNIER